MTEDPAANDSELALRASAGDEKAFTGLMRRHKVQIYRLIRRYVGDAEEAYDLVQETFTSAWLSIRSFDASRPFEAWIRRIALNKCRDWTRRRFVRRLIRPVLSLDEPSAFGAADESPDPERTTADRQSLQRLDRAIAELPPQLKEPLILVAFADMSQEAAAEFLGVTTKTIETRIYRARRKLSDLFGIDEA